MSFLKTRFRRPARRRCGHGAVGPPWPRLAYPTAARPVGKHARKVTAAAPPTVARSQPFSRAAAAAAAATTAADAAAAEDPPQLPPARDRRVASPSPTRKTKRPRRHWPPCATGKLAKKKKYNKRNKIIPTGTTIKDHTFLFTPPPAAYSGRCHQPTHQIGTF